MLLKKGAADYGARGHYEPPNFGFPVFAGSPSCSRCCVRARVEVDTSAGRLSEAKTQRRPTARERESERVVSFVVLLFLYLSFSRASKDT